MISECAIVIYYFLLVIVVIDFVLVITWATLVTRSSFASQSVNGNVMHYRLPRLVRLC